VTAEERLVEEEVIGAFTAADRRLAQWADGQTAAAGDCHVLREDERVAGGGRNHRRRGSVRGRFRLQIIQVGGHVRVREKVVAQGGVRIF